MVMPVSSIAACEDAVVVSVLLRLSKAARDGIGLYAAIQ